MSRRGISMILALLLVFGAFVGCADTEGDADPIVPDADPVTLTIAGSWPDCRALEEIGRAFTAKYPNCTIVYEYLQDYITSLEKRMGGDDPVDLFITSNLQDGSALLPYAHDLMSSEELDLSNTFPGLIENFAYREGGKITDRLYAIPLGAEMRGLYVNKTLLDSLNIAIPTDQASLLAACETLKQNGYIAFHGNPGGFAQTLIYPWICNIIANADASADIHGKVESKEAVFGEVFLEPMEFLYTLVENYYYDYKTAQTDLGLFVESSDEDYARYFLNIQASGDTWEKADDVGQIAFMPSPMSLQSVISKTKDDYHSKIEYVFMPAPISKDGGFVYLSPAHGIAANSTSPDLEWSVKFLNFLFQPENNEAFTKTFNVMPNTSEAFSYISTLYDTPSDHISHLGQVTFSYDFYSVIVAVLTDISKGNNPKYMQTNDDDSVSLYPLDYYLSQLEERVRA